MKKGITLKPLKFEDVIKALLKTSPPQTAKSKKKKKPKK